MHIIRVAAYTLLLCAAAGCGNGIDSTARITADDVRREVGRDTPEQSFLSDLQPQELAAWTVGKRFYVTDDKLKLMLGATAPDYPLEQQYIAYVGSSEVVTPTGARNTLLSFTTSRGDTVTYTSRLSLDELAGRRRVDIPFTVEQSMVDSVAARMLHNVYYILTPDRFTPAGDNTRRRKFVPVTVTAVHPGNSIYPVAVMVTDTPGGEPTMLYLNVGSTAVGANRSFDRLFSFTDPRKRYPAITDAHWDAIVANSALEGMTREETRLALGPPLSTDRRNTGSYIVELWTYENGRYLRFDDGVLREIHR